MWTLQTLQDSLSNEVDQSVTATAGVDWNIRLNLLNRAQKDWSETYDWSSLLKVYNGNVTADSFVTLSLPADFKKIDGYPLITWDGKTTDQFPVIDYSKRSQYQDSDRFTSVLGNDADNKVLVIHSNSLSSGASVQFTYYSEPISLASAGSVTQCTDGTYLIQRALYYLYKGREDGRFPEAKTEADRILSRMIENENSYGQSHQDNRIQRWEDKNFSFRIGRD